MTGPTVLVTGGAGYIGSHAVLALRDSCRDVVVVDNLSTGVREALPHDVPFHLGEVADAALMGKVLREHDIGTVMHFAGSISVPESGADPLKYYRNNTCASLSLARSCVDAGVDKLIFSSTAAVYGTPEASPVREDSATRPINPYGASKLMTETMLRDLAASRPSFRPVCLRYFNVAGADPQGRSGQRDPKSTGLVPAAVAAALGHGALAIMGRDYDTRDGTCERDYIHVSDLAQAHLAALVYLEAGGGPKVINCGYGSGYTVLEVIAALESILGREIAKRNAARRPGDTVSAVSDTSLMKATLDWRPRYDSLDVILKSALAWRERLPSAADAADR